MEPRFVIKNHSDINYVIGYLNTNHAKAANEGKPLVVTITCKQESLSAAQRRLYWLWMTEYGNHRGLDKEEASSFFKYKYLSVIYNRDNVVYQFWLPVGSDLHEMSKLVLDILRAPKN